MWTKANTILTLTLCVIVVADFFIPGRDHPVYWWHYMPAFDFILGLAACLLIIKGSKLLAKHELQRRKDYYD